MRSWSGAGVEAPHTLSARDHLIASLEAGERTLQTIGIAGLAFPYDGNAPPSAAECFDLRAVPRDVGPKLVLPEEGIALRRRRSRAIAMSVPEAPMHEEGKAPGREDEVGRAGQILAMQAKA